MAGHRKTREAKRAAIAALNAAASQDAPLRPRLPMPGPDSPVADRVEYVVQLMHTGQWDGYPTRMALATAWGIAESTVRNYSAEAKHRLLGDPEEREQMRAALAGKAMEVLGDTQVTRHDLTGMRDNMAALRAIELTAKLMGIDLDVAKRDAGDSDVAMKIIVTTDDDDADKPKS